MALTVAVAVAAGDEAEEVVDNIHIMSIRNNRSVSQNRHITLSLLSASLVMAGTLAASAATSGKSFSSPEEAVRALAAALDRHDSNAITVIFGPGIQELRSADAVQGQNEIEEFMKRFNASNHIERVSNNWSVLEIGEDRWPFAIPIVKKGSSWFFDTEAGKEELLNRRIGNNELEALKSVRAYVEAQREYARKDRDDDEVLEYAQRIASSPNAKDGLFWSEDIDDEESPLGPLYAEAQSKGYFKEPKDQDAAPQAFNGYHFKILTKQGKHAPGGAFDYLINGNMIGGFALVAWPADYGSSGVMTFIINQQGKVFQKDLGKETDAIVEKMTTYDPDPSWTHSWD